MQTNNGYTKIVKTKPTKQQSEKPRYNGKQWKRTDKRHAND